MANNRLWIVDTETNEKILLAKSSGDGWYIYHDIDKLNEWFELKDCGASYDMCPKKTKLILKAENDEYKNA